MGDGIAIRCYGDLVDRVYGGANDLIKDFSYWAEIPVINMEEDKYHNKRNITRIRYWTIGKRGLFFSMDSSWRNRV